MVLLYFFEVDVFPCPQVLKSEKYLILEAEGNGIV